MDIRLELLATAREREVAAYGERSALRRAAAAAVSCCRRFFGLLPAQRSTNAASVPC